MNLICGVLQLAIYGVIGLQFNDEAAWLHGTHTHVHVHVAEFSERGSCVTNFTNVNGALTFLVLQYLVADLYCCGMDRVCLDEHFACTMSCKTQGKGFHSVCIYMYMYVCT